MLYYEATAGFGSLRAGLGMGSLACKRATIGWRGPALAPRRAVCLGIMLPICPRQRSCVIADVAFRPRRESSP